MDIIAPVTVATALVVLLLIVCVGFGFTSFIRNNSYLEYFLAKSSLGPSENAASYFGRFTSLATVLTFFLIFSSREGIYIAVAPVTVLLGVLLFNRLARNYKPVDPGCTSLFGHLESYYKDPMLSRMVLILSMFAIFMILLIELYVGARILEVLLPSNSGNNLYSLIIVGAIVFLYVGLGGLRSIVITDKIQSYVITLFSIVSFIVFAPKVASVSLYDLFPRDAVSVQNWTYILPLPLLLNIIIVNFFLFPSLYSTWQMRFASSSNSHFLRGNLRGAVRVFITWCLFIAIGILLAKEFGELPFSLGETAILISRSDNTLLAYFVFPLLLVASLSALLSTADNAIIPIVQIIYDTKFDKEEFTIAKPITIAMLLMLLVFILYYFFFIYLSFDFLKAIFSVFGFSVILTPIIMWPVIFPNDSRASSRSGIFKISLLLGFISLIATITIGYQSNSNSIIQLAPVFGFTIVSLIVGLSYILVGKIRD